MIPKPRLILLLLPLSLTLYGIFSQTERIITNNFVKEWGFFKMKRKIITLFTLICLALPIQASAYTFQSLPIASKSKQWYIEIDKSHNSNKQAVQPKQGVYDTYSLLLKNIGNDVANVSVEILDNTPTSKVTFNPTTSNNNVSKSHTSFDYMVFPLDFNSHNFKVVITWEEKIFSYNGHPVNESKKMKQTFVFNEE